MANQEHLRIIKQGVEVWNRWRVKNPDVRPNLSDVGLYRACLIEADLNHVNLYKADLSQADLSQADLNQANLNQANLGGSALNGADLRGANAVDANLYEANFCGANLSGVDLRGAKLMKARLIEANLIGANLSGANFIGANLSHAIVGFTIFADLDLRMVTGLERIYHVAPSTIGIDTIYRSKGKISKAFLQGAGVPDTFITYTASLTAEAIQYYSCFISYSHKDQVFAERLHNDLQSKGVRCWLDREDLRAGRKLYEQIDQAIRVHEKVLLVLSEHSMQSEWVMTEIRQARKAQIRDGRRKLFPVRLVAWETIRDWKCFDGDTGKDLAVEVREYFIPDFSRWKDHDSYQKAFDCLMRDLKAE
jgi:uncharacterized protein YjbI with pentapeptide repeats